MLDAYICGHLRRTKIARKASDAAEYIELFGKWPGKWRTLPRRAALLWLGSESLDESGEVRTPTAESIKDCTTQIQDLVIARLNAAISCKLLQLVNVLHDSYTGQSTLTQLRLAVCVCVCVVWWSRRNNLSRSFFQDICKPTSCLHYLIPPPRDTSVTTRLRLTTSLPRPNLRTKKYCSLINFYPAYTITNQHSDS